MSPEACKRYLEQLRVILWPAVAFDLQDDKEVVKAAQWLSETITAAWQGAPIGVSDQVEEEGWVYESVGGSAVADAVHGGFRYIASGDEYDGG